MFDSNMEQGLAQLLREQLQIAINYSLVNAGTCCLFLCVVLLLITYLKPVSIAYMCTDYLYSYVVSCYIKSLRYPV